MKRKIFFGIVVLISIVIILFNNVESLKYMTCSEYGVAIVIIEEITEEDVTIRFSTPGSLETLRAYEYHQEDEVLYVCAKYWANPIGTGTGDFTITIETYQEISTIIYKGSKEAVVVYPTD